MAFDITVGIGLAVLLAALTTGAAFAVTGIEATPFLIARICWFIAATDIIGFAVWLTARADRVSYWQIGAAALCGLIAIGALVGALQWTNYREIMSSRILVPGDLPTPSHQAIAGNRVPQGALLVFLGSNLAWGTKMPHTVLMMGGDPMITIDRQENTNRLVITTLRIFDDRNNIIARIDDEGFWVENTTRSKRPNASTLQVFDHTDTEVLRIEFLNPGAISVTGIFRHSGIEKPVIITPTQAIINGMSFATSSFGGAKVADIAVE